MRGYIVWTFPTDHMAKQQIFQEGVISRPSLVAAIAALMMISSYRLIRPLNPT